MRRNRSHNRIIPRKDLDIGSSVRFTYKFVKSLTKTGSKI